MSYNQYWERRRRATDSRFSAFNRRHPSDRDSEGWSSQYQPEDRYSGFEEHRQRERVGYCPNDDSRYGEPYYHELWRGATFDWPKFPNVLSYTDRFAYPTYPIYPHAREEFNNPHTHYYRRHRERHQDSYNGNQDHVPVNNNSNLRAPGLERPSSFLFNSEVRDFTPSVPAAFMETKKPLLVVFDLNGVLVKNKIPHVRPFATEFIDFVAKNFYIAVWSSAKKENVDLMVKKAFSVNQKILLEQWDRSYCELEGKFHLKCNTYKDLRKLWKTINGRYYEILGSRFDETNTIIIDDSPIKIKYQPANQIMLSEYGRVNAKDDELRRLKDYFELLVQNIPENRQPFDIRAFLKNTPFQSSKII